MHPVFFAGEATATAAGYRPRAVCLPAEHGGMERGREGLVSVAGREDQGK
jgi:methylphosphotriester-DNA--protein-cysteine methyltransferase